jgi:hypothetical protein
LQLRPYAEYDKKVESSGATVHNFGTNNATIDLTDTGNDAFLAGEQGLGEHALDRFSAAVTPLFR